jgi:hypothetical protein
VTSGVTEGDNCWMVRKLPSRMVEMWDSKEDPGARRWTLTNVEWGDLATAIMEGDLAHTSTDDDFIASTL